MMLGINEKAYLIRIRKKKTKTDMARVLKMEPSRYSIFEKGELIDPVAGEIVTGIYNAFVYAKPLTLKEKMLILKLRRRDLHLYISETVFWNLYSGMGWKKHGDEVKGILFQVGGDLFEESDFREVTK
jgi:transcriptional regulator with XRE-family HTH domain